MSLSGQLSNKHRIRGALLLLYLPLDISKHFIVLLCLGLFTTDPANSWSYTQKVLGILARGNCNISNNFANHCGRNFENSWKSEELILETFAS